MNSSLEIWYFMRNPALQNLAWIYGNTPYVKNSCYRCKITSLNMAMQPQFSVSGYNSTSFTTLKALNSFYHEADTFYILTLCRNIYLVKELFLCLYITLVKLTTYAQKRRESYLKQGLVRPLHFFLSDIWHSIKVLRDMASEILLVLKSLSFLHFSTILAQIVISWESIVLFRRIVWWVDIYWCLWKI